MNQVKNRSKLIPVLAAAAVLIVLAGSLGARLIAKEDVAPAPDAPSAFVPLPESLPIEELEIPCWSCPYAKKWAIRFRTDLDLLAPLGDGAGNAADWFGDFAKTGGPRRADVIEARKRLVEGPDGVGQILPPDDPILLEAEPWCDQATMKFYPEIFEFTGYATAITDLLFPLNLVRSWVARGRAAADTEEAMEDFRRAIRLGRLLRQEDVVVISDLVGLACIHIGARGIYDRALADGDLETALLASAVIGEVAPQRLSTMKRITQTDLADSIREDGRGGYELVLRPGKLDTIAETAQGAPERRFRAEAMLGLSLIRSHGSTEERARAHEVLDAIAAEDDAMIALIARWARDHDATEDDLKDWAGVSE